MVVHDLGFAWRLLRGGDIGVAESYLRGEWETPNLTEFLYLFCVNVEMMQAILRGKPLVRWAQVFRHWLNRNTRRQARKNIHAHYDLGNEFYRAWLDPTMTYSSALFDQGSNDLSAAQLRKYESLAQQIDLKPGQSVLEIGCGWGGFAEYAAKTYGANVTGLTISQEQHDYARKRMFDAGFADRVTIKMQDYRDETGVYDRIASIEMIEAVGEQFWPDFFRQMSDRLVAGGIAGIQAITIQERFFLNYRREIDYIRRYVFPGGMLPSPTILKSLGAQFRHSAGARESIRRRLRAHALGVARPFPRRVACARAAGFRRAFPPAVGILPRVLRGRISVAQYRRAADDFCEASLAARSFQARSVSVPTSSRHAPAFSLRKSRASSVLIFVGRSSKERFLLAPFNRGSRAPFGAGAETVPSDTATSLAIGRPRQTALHCGVFQPWDPSSLSRTARESRKGRYPGRS